MIHSLDSPLMFVLKVPLKFKRYFTSEKEERCFSNAEVDYLLSRVRSIVDKSWETCNVVSIMTKIFTDSELSIRV